MNSAQHSDKHTPLEGAGTTAAPPQLMQALAEWRATVDAMRDAVCLLGPTGRIRRCNRAMRQLLGLSFADIRGRSCWQLIYSQSKPPAGCDLSWHPLEQPTTHPLISHELDDNWYSVSIQPIHDPNGTLLGMVHFMVDVTEARHTEELLRHDSDQLKTQHDIDTAVMEVRPPCEMTGEALRQLRRGINIVAASVTVFDEQAREADVFVVVDEGITAPTDARVSIPADWVEALHRGETCEVPDPCLVLPQPRWGESLEDVGVGATLSVPLLTRGQLIGALNLALPNNSVLTAAQTQTVNQAAVSLAVSLQNAHLYQSVNEQRQRLHDLGTRMTNTEEQLRQRLAQELHDRVGQILTALGINLTHVRGLLSTESPNVFERLDEALDQIAEISDSIRDVMAELRPAVLDDYGLVAALRWYAQQFGRRATIDVLVVELTPSPRLPQETETALFRIAQEALTNISKHASASIVRITVNTTDTDIIMQIKDNGVGFETDSVQRRGATGWGLMTMQERAESINGTCTIDSQPGHGATVGICVRRQV
jgi:PAS domain S-box-containing protein